MRGAAPHDTPEAGGRASGALGPVPGPVRRRVIVRRSSRCVGQVWLVVRNGGKLDDLHVPSRLPTRGARPFIPLTVRHRAGPLSGASPWARRRTNPASRAPEPPRNNPNRTAALPGQRGRGPPADRVVRPSPLEPDLRRRHPERCNKVRFDQDPCDTSVRREPPDGLCGTNPVQPKGRQQGLEPGHGPTQVLPGRRTVRRAVCVSPVSRGRASCRSGISPRSATRLSRLVPPPAEERHYCQSCGERKVPGDPHPYP